jgi:hypothetical protein
MSERDARTQVHPDSGIIWAAMRQGRHHLPEPKSQGLAIYPITKPNPRNAAHKFCETASFPIK